MSRAAGHYGSWETGGWGRGEGESWRRGVTWTFVLMTGVRGARLRGEGERGQDVTWADF